MPRLEDPTGGRWPNGGNGGACALAESACWKFHGNQSAGWANTAERLSSKALK